MPSTTDTFNDIRREQRVVHSRYGRGVVKLVRRPDDQAVVLFDDDARLYPDTPRTVLLKHLTPEPADMPACHSDPQPLYRLVWPLDAVAGEGEVW
jgi:hypothetical protein